VVPSAVSFERSGAFAFNGIGEFREIAVVDRRPAAAFRIRVN